MVIEYPKVLIKKNEEVFNPERIYNSLLKETTISETNAKIVTDRMCRYLIAHKFNILTSPMIREMICGKLLEIGLEKERLQYTRIGVPYYEYDKMDEDERIDQMDFEYIAVRRLIYDLEE